MARFATLTADAAIASSILNAPGWARVGITMPDPDMRERAAREIARSLLEQLTAPVVDDVGDQIRARELEAIAGAWNVDPAQVIASLPDRALLIDGEV